MTITRDELRALLVDCQIVPYSAAELDDDTPIVIDSFALVWLIQMLQERYNIVLDPSDEDVKTFTSVRSIHDYLSARQSL
ncbi:MAG TPA: hypothetical protein VIL44_10940 [Micromonospora sp.]